MRYPPALSYTPQRSRVYASVVALITIILIALCVDFIPASGHFSLKNSVFLLLTAAVSLWLVYDAYRKPRGHLHYAQGVWTWQLENQEIAGTCALHVDLQTYMLVSFVACQENSRHLSKTTQWFHLEAGQFANSSHWAALRRAVYSPAQPAYEAVVA